MRAVLLALDGGRLRLAENAIQAMLADAAEPGLSAAMIHIQLALAALGREDEREAKHHLAHFTAAAPQAQSIHGLAATDALVDDDPLDAMLHLRSLGQLEAERLRDVRGCSGVDHHSAGHHQ